MFQRCAVPALPPYSARAVHSWPMCRRWGWNGDTAPGTNERHWCKLSTTPHTFRFAGGCPGSRSGCGAIKTAWVYWSQREDAVAASVRCRADCFVGQVFPCVSWACDEHPAPHAVPPGVARCAAPALLALLAGCGGGGSTPADANDPGADIGGGVVRPCVHQFRSRCCSGSIQPMRRDTRAAVPLVTLSGSR